MPLIDLNESFEFRGHRIATARFGEGPPLVLLHGTPFSSQVWRRIAPLLSRHRRVHLFDLLGYGESDQPSGTDISLGVQNALLAELWTHWGLSDADVVAHDFGGTTALRGTIINKLPYRTLTLVDPVALSPWGSVFVQYVRQHKLAFTDLPDFAHKALLAAYIQGAVHQPLPAEALNIYMRPWLSATGKAAFYEQIAQMDQRYTDEILPGLGTVHCPVKVVWGEEDAWIPISRGRELVELLPQAELRAVPGAGHLIQEDAPEAILDAIHSFL